MDECIEIKIRVVARMEGCVSAFDERKALSAYMAKLKNLGIAFRTGERMYTVEANEIGGERDGEGGD